MSEEQKLIAKLAAQFLVAAIQNGGLSGDLAYSERALRHARNIVRGSKDQPHD
jgi:hypothetical protein